MDPDAGILVKIKCSDPTDVLDGVETLSDFGVRAEHLRSIPVEVKLDLPVVWKTRDDNSSKVEPHMPFFAEYYTECQSYRFCLLADRWYIVYGKDIDYVSPELIAMNMPAIRQELGQRIEDDIGQRTPHRVLVHDVTSMDEQYGNDRRWELTVQIAFTFSASDS